jgi:hypothetical protein
MQACGLCDIWSVDGAAVLTCDYGFQPMSIVIGRDLFDRRPNVATLSFKYTPNRETFEVVGATNAELYACTGDRMHVVKIEELLRFRGSRG